MIYKDYKLIAEKNNNVITFKDLQRGTYTELSNITRLYKEFNECFYNLALPKKFSKEYTLIGNGKTNIIKNNYDFIFYSYFNYIIYLFYFVNKVKSYLNQFSISIPSVT